MDKLVDSRNKMNISTPPVHTSKSGLVRRKLALPNEGDNLGTKSLEPEPSGRVLRPRPGRQPCKTVVEPVEPPKKDKKESKTYACPECNREFKQKKKLINHRRIGHKVDSENLLVSPPPSARPDPEEDACMDIDMVQDENCEENDENIEPPADPIDATSKSAAMLRYIQDCENFHKDNNPPQSFQPMTPSASSSPSSGANNDGCTSPPPQRNRDIATQTPSRRVQFSSILVPTTPPSQFLVAQNPGPVHTPNAQASALPIQQNVNPTVPNDQLLNQMLVNEGPVGPRQPQQQGNMQCNLCNLQFFTKAALKNHFECHEGLRPFPCPTCYYSYETETQLMEHYSTKHSGEALFECGGCRKRYKTSRWLKNHKILQKCNTPSTSTQ